MLWPYWPYRKVAPVEAEVHIVLLLFLGLYWNLTCIFFMLCTLCF